MSKIVLVLVTLGFTGLACGSSDKEGESGAALCTALTDKAKSCNLTGTPRCDLVNSDAAHQCAGQCFVDADCANLTAPARGNPYFVCQAKCAGLGADAFICEDGSGFLDPRGVCDGRYACPDGSDEADCTPVADAGPG